MFFATSVLHLHGTIVGIIVSISTLWDGLSDTIVGYLSDTRPIGKLGRRNSYMLIAVIGMSISNILLWCVPNDIHVVLKIVWILIALLIVETFNTMFSTPYTALGNELASSYSDRTSINAVSSIFYLLGVVIPSILFFIFLPDTNEYPVGQLNPKGYVWIALVSSAICFIFGIICTLCARNSHESVKNTNYKKFSILKILKSFSAVVKNNRVRRLMIGYILTSVATVFLCSVGLHFFTYAMFYTSSQITILLLSLMLGTIISQPLWIWISSKFNKKSALIFGIVFTIISVFLVIVVYLFRVELEESSYYLMLVSIFACGVGSGSLYSLPTSMYGDEIMSGNNSNMVATFSGALTFSGNIANSITQLLVGVLLDIIAFDPIHDIQSLSVQTGLALILFVGVQSSLILACMVFASHKERKIQI